MWYHSKNISRANQYYENLIEKTKNTLNLVTSRLGHYDKNMEPMLNKLRQENFFSN